MLTREKLTVVQWQAVRNTPHQVIIAVSSSGGSAFDEMLERSAGLQGIVDAINSTHPLVSEIAGSTHIMHAQDDVRKWFYTLLSCGGDAPLPPPLPPRRPPPTLSAPVLAAEPQAVRLFNGKDLAGWSHFLVDPKVRMEEVWSVRNGILVGKGEPLGFLQTTAEYTSFKLVVEWRWAPGAAARLGKTPNSGVLMRVNGEPKPIPRSIEAQLRSGDAGDLYGFWGMAIEGDPARRQ